MDRTTRRELVAKYKDGHKAVADAVQRIPKSKLDAKPAPHEWSPREVIHHLADAEMTNAVWLRMLLAQNHPLIHEYNESEFPRRLYYDRPIEVSLAALQAARETTAELLERLTDDQWKREGFHTGTGRYTVETWLEACSAHAHDHAEQLLRAAGMGDAGEKAANDEGESYRREQADYTPAVMRKAA